MAKTDVTQLDHYAKYPMCGYCTEAWDIIYQRTRSSTSPATWSGYCPVGGCDPDIWNYLTDSGWPKRWPIDKERHRPDWVKVGMLEPPPYDDRCFHKRSEYHSADNAPWRRISDKLLALVQIRKAEFQKLRATNGDIVWDEEDEAEFSDPDAELPDLDDPDLW